MNIIRKCVKYEVYIDNRIRVRTHANQFSGVVAFASDVILQLCTIFYDYE